MVRVSAAGKDSVSSEFDILATLRRSGAPYALNPSQIVSALMINNSTLTSRLDRLEKHGHLIRVPIVGDRRSVHVQLTDSGFQLIDELVGKHVANERVMMSSSSWWRCWRSWNSTSPASKRSTTAAGYRRPQTSPDRSAAARCRPPDRAGTARPRRDRR
ncbi:MarR family transcriptional regulator [Erwinia aphidicola]|uniref:MarR family transcriptional regulator n=1 Tax=Erwinia aphidicola TaxID=68334 RepID=UPI003D21EF61